MRPFAGMPRQANSHDCGAIVAASAEWILAQFLSGRSFPWDAAGAAFALLLLMLAAHAMTQSWPPLSITETAAATGSSSCARACCPPLSHSFQG